MGLQSKYILYELYETVVFVYLKLGYAQGFNIIVYHNL